MSKRWVAAAVIGGLAWVLVMALRGQKGDKGRPDKWDKMRRFMDEMPADFPPRVMFDNLAATRENTERILAILGQARAPGEQPGAEAKRE